MELMPGKYDPRTAWHLARASDAAYGTSDDQAAWCAQHGWQDHVPLQSGGTESFLAVNDQQVLLAWRGTTSITDWLTDANVRMERGPFNNSDKVHAGFNGYVDQVWQALKDALEYFDGRELFITGHSLGGAAAEVRAARLIAQGVPIHGLYTFGKPMAGNHSFATIFDHRARVIAHRVVHQNDVVCRLPYLLGILGRYRHTCRHSTHHLAADGLRWVNPGWLRMMWNRYAGTLNGWLRWASDGALDHDVDRYVARLGLEAKGAE